MLLVLKKVISRITELIHYWFLSITVAVILVAVFLVGVGGLIMHVLYTHIAPLRGIPLHLAGGQIIGVASLFRIGLGVHGAELVIDHISIFC